MEGTYKIYDEDKEEWINLPLFFKGDRLWIKIEDGHLWSSYDRVTWEDVGKLNTKLYRLEYTSPSKSLAGIQPCNINYSKHEYDGETGEGAFIFNEAPTSIRSSAFYSCTSLTSITIPNSVTSIGASAFNNCTSLTSITIPNSVTSIGASAFNNCTSLTSATIPDSVTSIGYQAFYECTSLTSVAIPDSVTSIGAWAFYSCKGLTSVTIGNGVTSISSYAFYHCTSLTSVTIGNGVTSIGDYAFRGCTSLTSVAIPDSVTSIGDYAFRGCTSLTSVTIPDSITEIGHCAFDGCISLKEVYCKPTTPPTIQNDTLNSNIETIYVTSESVGTYKSTTNWSNYGDNMVGSEILSLSDDSLMSVSISLEERIKRLESIIAQ